MDLLFKHRQYDLVLDVYTGLQRFNIDCVTLALGAHYHINTPESAEAARNMIRVLMQQYYLSRRALMYAAMLFLKQNLPHVALETLKHCREGTLVFNLQLMCYAKLGQIQDILKGLDEAVERANIITKPLNIRLYSDTMCEIRQAMAKCDNQRSVQKFDFLEKDLSGLGVFSLQTASVLLDKTIHGERHRLKESGKRKVVRVD
uniref:Pentatricopeptide repeat-containing protein 2, mitochondrial n=2 Tax=Arion vulgaris TaxID=1028688 RepID=A0A0B7AF01_9EUPU